MATNKYHDFFMNTEEGQKYLKALEGLIEAKHQKAEDNPGLEATFTQQAKGIREALKQAQSMSTEAKKPS